MWVQSCKHSTRIPVDNCQNGSGRGFRSTASALPVLDRIQAETKSRGEACLGHLQPLPDALYVYFGGQVTVHDSICAILDTIFA